MKLSLMTHSCHVQIADILLSQKLSCLKYDAETPGSLCFFDTDLHKKRQLILSRGVGESLHTSFCPSWLQPLSSFTVRNKSSGYSLEETILTTLTTLQEAKIVFQKIMIWRGKETSPFLPLEEIASTNQLPFLSVASRKLAETLQAQHAFDSFLVCLQKEHSIRHCKQIF